MRTDLGRLSRENIALESENRWQSPRGIGGRSHGSVGPSRSLAKLYGALKAWMFPQLHPKPCSCRVFTMSLHGVSCLRVLLVPV